MVFDHARGHVVLFGGRDGAGLLNDTWEWDGQAWTLLGDGGPPPRRIHAATYDTCLDVIVMFGGDQGFSGNSLLGDTWEFGGTNSNDCNANTIPDECDISAGVSQDANANGIPDECEPCVAPGLLEARSVAVHHTSPATTAEFYVGLDISNDPARRTSEPRSTGLQIFDFVFDRPIVSGDIAIFDSAGLVDSGNMTLLDGGTRGRVTLDDPLPKRTVYRIAVQASAGPGCDVVHDICVVALVGDFNSDGRVNALDKAELLGFMFQQVAQPNARYDVQVNQPQTGFINVNDLGFWTGFFGLSVEGEGCP